MTTPPHPPQGPYGPQNPQDPYGPPTAAPGPVPHQQPYGYPQPAPPPQDGWGHPGPQSQEGGGRGEPGPQAQPGSGWDQPGPPAEPTSDWSRPNPQPGAGGWPPQNPPPRKKRTGLIVGIALGAMVVAGGIVFGVSQLADKGSDLVYPKAEYRLVVQKQLLDGEFTLGDDLSETEGKEIEETPDVSIRDAEAVVAHYTSEEGGALILSGMYGRLASPDLMRGTIMEGAADAEDGKLVVPPKEFKPQGYDIVIECQVVQSKKAGVVANVPMCAWADDNTAAMIALIRAGDVTKDAKSLDLAAAAEETAKVREEARKPLG
ncbi:MULTISPECIES: hypothetical protein [Streptomyces]|uniref:hypothetical protein n=1 Tax=Streptomyces TaxID=1883 RepID=UPI0005BA8B76|nr:MULTISPECIES: hypothetical protein [Streptomyces]MDP9952140.1 hypothetical protein [Streptomyces sp. DSM 41269]